MTVSDYINLKYQRLKVLKANAIIYYKKNGLLSFIKRIFVFIFARFFPNFFYRSDLVFIFYSKTLSKNDLIKNLKGSNCFKYHKKILYKALNKYIFLNPSENQTRSFSSSSIILIFLFDPNYFRHAIKLRSLSQTNYLVSSKEISSMFNKYENIHYLDNVINFDYELAANIINQKVQSLEYLQQKHSFLFAINQTTQKRILCYEYNKSHPRIVFCLNKSLNNYIKKINHSKLPKSFDDVVDLFANVPVYLSEDLFWEYNFSDLGAEDFIFKKISQGAYIDYI